LVQGLTEMKNLNSFRSLVNAIENETKRQIKVLESGGEIVQETRKWDDAKGKNTSLRSKEEAHDYRYFPEPDLVPVVLGKSYVEQLKSELPELPHIKKERYIKELGLPEYDAGVITVSLPMTRFFEECVANYKGDVKTISNWVMGELMRILKDRNMEAEQIPFPPAYLIELLELIDNGTISGSAAKKVFENMFDSKEKPAVIVEKLGLVQISDEGALKEIVEKILQNNPGSVEDYKNGKKKAFGFLVGQTMRETKGKANPQLVNRILKELLDS